MDDLLNLADYAICSAKFPKAGQLFFHDILFCCLSKQFSADKTTTKETISWVFIYVILSSIALPLPSTLLVNLTILVHILNSRYMLCDYYDFTITLVFISFCILLWVPGMDRSRIFSKCSCFNAFEITKDQICNCNLG